MPSVHHFNVEDARLYGVEAATFLYNIRFWLDKNKANKDHIHDGRVWTYNSQEAWCELFPYFTRRQVQRILKKLCDAGILLKGNHNKNKFDKTVWYSLDLPEYRLQPPESPIAPNGAIESTERCNGVPQTVQCLQIKNHIKNTTTTGKAKTGKKLEFDIFALALIETLNEMIAEGGWLPNDKPAPRAPWLKRKAETLYSKLPDPCPVDCAVIALKDWTKLVH